MTRTFDLTGQEALMFGGQSCLTPGTNLTALGHETPQRINVLVIDGDVIRVEKVFFTAAAAAAGTTPIIVAHALIKAVIVVTPAPARSTAPGPGIVIVAIQDIIIVIAHRSVPFSDVLLLVMPDWSRQFIRSKSVIFVSIVGAVEVVNIAPVAEENHLIGNQFRTEVARAIIVFPAARLQPPLDIDLLAFVEVRFANLGQIAPGHHVKPLGFFAAFTLRRGPGAAGRNAKTGNGPTAGGIPQFGITSQAADDHDFIQSASHSRFAPASTPDNN
jgi:hypothetical protein